jgi:hypothetical protein
VKGRDSPLRRQDSIRRQSSPMWQHTPVPVTTTCRSGFFNRSCLDFHPFYHGSPAPYGKRESPTPVEFRQQASYAQLFWAIREGLVASVIGERLEVGTPFQQRLIAGRLELVAAGARRPIRTEGRVSPSPSLRWRKDGTRPGESGSVLSVVS